MDICILPNTKEDAIRLFQIFNLNILIYIFLMFTRFVVYFNITIIIYYCILVFIHLYKIIFGTYLDHRNTN